MSFCYKDFGFPILDYFIVTKRAEYIYEWGVPLVISIIICLFVKVDIETIKAFSSLVVDMFAILIGFTITAIAILATIDIKKHSILSKSSKRKIFQDEISYFRFIYINLIFSCITGITIVCLALFSVIVSSILYPQLVFFVLVFGVLFNLFLTIRNMTNIYFALFAENK